MVASIIKIIALLGLILYAIILLITAHPTDPPQGPHYQGDLSMPVDTPHVPHIAAPHYPSIQEEYLGVIDII